VASIVLIEVACEGPEVRFDPGSKITLSAKSRSGPPLSSLTANPTPVTSAVPPTQAAPQPVPRAPAGAAPVTAVAAGSSPQPNFTVLKDDFIPGEKIVLYDDFTDMAADEAPPHWKVRGASLTLMAAGGIRQVMANDKVTMTPMISGFPTNFTLETDVKYEKYARSGWYFSAKGPDDVALQVWMETRGGTALRVYVRTHEEMLNDSEFKIDLTQPVKEAIWIQDGRVRVYLNGQRVVDANQVKLPQFASARLEADPSDNQHATISYRRVRIAESTPDFSRSIAASGRYISHGILFDTDSDCLKPESGAVIKSVARGLETNPNLKLRIEGHTDSTGNADHNLDLIKAARRSGHGGFGNAVQRGRRPLERRRIGRFQTHGFQRYPTRPGAKPARGVRPAVTSAQLNVTTAPTVVRSATACTASITRSSG
jgi:outer membrane protein OmpA-like peptidoglycan-associated protein